MCQYIDRQWEVANDPADHVNVVNGTVVKYATCKHKQTLSIHFILQLSLLPSVWQEISTSQKGVDALWLASKGRHGSFHL